MHFNVEIDDGNQIVGYIVPDAASKIASLRITDGERDLLVMPCNQDRPILVTVGRHETGRCGFVINQSIIPDLPEQKSLAIYEEETNLLIYRRRAPSEVVQKKVLRIETHLFPLWEFDDALEPHFQYFHKGIERHGRETTTQFFELHNSESLYLSGRLFFKQFESYVSGVFNCITLIHEPFMELAERLLTLRNVRKFSKTMLGERDTMILAPAIEFAEAIELDETKLHRAFASMPKDVIANLANPLTRQFSAISFDEMVTGRSVPAALRTLASCAVIGLRQKQEFFLRQVSELLGTPLETLARSPTLAKAAQLAVILRKIPEASVLIERDLEVYDHVRSAVESAVRDHQLQ
jgi:hypothetical protein